MQTGQTNKRRHMECKSLSEKNKITSETAESSRVARIPFLSKGKKINLPLICCLQMSLDKSYFHPDANPFAIQRDHFKQEVMKVFIKSVLCLQKKML